MSESLTTARRILERTGDHPVVSLYLDLDPAEFATPPARATQLVRQGIGAVLRF